MATKEFKVPPNAGSSGVHGWARLIAWIAVACLIAIAIYSSDSRSNPYALNLGIAIFAALMVVVAMIGGFWFAARLGLERTKRKLRFSLTDSELTVHRADCSDGTIAMSEVADIRETREGLIVESVDLSKRIFVPREVGDFDLLRAELAKHRPIASVRSRLSAAVLLNVLCVAGLLIMIFDNDIVVRRAAAVLAVALLAWSSVQLGLRFRGRKPKVVWVWLGISWVAAVFVLMDRIK